MDVSESSSSEVRRLQNSFEQAGELGVAFSPSKYYRVMTTTDSLYVFHAPSGELRVIEKEEVVCIRAVESRMTVGAGLFEKLFGFSPWVECVEVELVDESVVQVGVKSQSGLLRNLEPAFDEFDVTFVYLDA